MSSPRPASHSAELGQTLRYARERKGFTQPQIAELLNEELGENFRAPTISKIEKGTRPLSLQEAAALSRILEISPSSMFEHFGELTKAESRLDQLSERLRALSYGIKGEHILEATRIREEFRELQALYEQEKFTDLQEVSVIFSNSDEVDEQLGFIIKLLSRASEQALFVDENINLGIAASMEADRQKGK